MNYTLEAYRTARDALAQYVDQQYPVGCVVRVDNPRYKGMGIAMRNSICAPDRLPVLLSNGNVWWYELETIVARVDDQEEWPGWIRPQEGGDAE